MGGSLAEIWTDCRFSNASAQACRRHLTLVTIALLGALSSSAARAEVLDKYSDPGWIVLIVGAAALSGLLLALWSLWTLLITWPVSLWVFGFGLMAEFHAPDMRPALMQEGGWQLAMIWHSMALVGGAWPLALLLLRRPAAPAASLGKL